MNIFKWVEFQLGPEAKLRRLEKEVQRKELAAEFAKKELPLLIKKDQALTVINQRDKVKQSVRAKQMDRMQPRANQIAKTPTQRVYKT